MSLGGKFIVYYNQHLESHKFPIKDGFEWGKLHISTYGEIHIYDCIVYNKRMESDQIKNLINTLAKYHKVPQKIRDLNDRLDILEKTVKALN